MKLSKTCDFCVLIDRIFPFSHDATACVASRFVDALRKQGENTIVCAKAVQIRKRRICRMNGVTYVLIRDNDVSMKELSEVAKNSFFLRKFLLFGIAFLEKRLFKKSAKKRTLIYLKRVGSAMKESKTNNLVLFCGNFYLCDAVKEKTINFKKSILIATDYWKFYFSDDALSTFGFSKIYAPESVDFSKVCDASCWGLCRPFMGDVSKMMEDGRREKGRCCYFGGFYSARDYEKFLSILNACDFCDVYVFSNLKKDVCSKYGNVHCEEMRYGKDYFKELSKADILFVLDNNSAYREWIPSKMYEAMATHRPILLFSDSEDSPSWRVLSKYPLALFVDLNDENAISTIKCGIASFSGKVSSKGLFDIYPDCDVSYFLKNVLIRE